MIYTELTNKAMKLAYNAHKDQYDTGGLPYIFHSYHLAEQMNTEMRVCIALLHDVVEDTDIAMEQLKGEFPTEVTDALELLTHDQSVEYYDYVKGICSNLDASFVKLADIIHNMTESRLAGTDIGTEEKDWWFKKYAKALYLIADSVEKNVSPNFEDGFLYRELMSRYQGMDRQISISVERKPQEFLTDEQYAILSNLSIDEQMKYFKIECVRSRKGTYSNDYSEVKHFSLESFMNGYRSFFLADGCIVGILDINPNGTHCKKRVQPFWINGDARYIEEYNFIDHSWDHYAAACEEKKVRLVWRE